MRLNWMGPALLGVAWLAACAPCESINDTVNTVCTSGGVPADAPFSVKAEGRSRGNSTYDGVTCVVDRSGNIFSLKLQGAACSADQSSPVVTMPSASCALPALPAGTYTIGGRSVTVPSAAGAADGLPGC